MDKPDAASGGDKKPDEIKTDRRDNPYVAPVMVTVDQSYNEAAYQQKNTEN